MTEERFEDLVNLYLDNEIGRHELDELKRVIKENLARRKQFERACQLHQAARKALVSQAQDKRPLSPTETRGTPAKRLGTQPTISQMQERARVNASVPVQAERQTSAGAAATMYVEDVAASGRRRRGSRPGKHATWTAPLTLQAKLLITGLAVAMGVAYYYSSSNESADSYTPEMPETPLPPKGSDGNKSLGMLDGGMDGASGQPYSAGDLIQARIKATALTGNSVTQRLLTNMLTTQVVNNGENGTQQWSVHVTEQMYIRTSNLNATTSVTEQMQRSMETTPAMAPVTPPPEIEVVPQNNLSGNGTLEKDLQP